MRMSRRCFPATTINESATIRPRGLDSPRGEHLGGVADRKKAGGCSPRPDSSASVATARGLALLMHCFRGGFMAIGQGGRLPPEELPRGQLHRFL